MEIVFKADKKHRDKYFSAGSFAHPAKMMLPLQRWLIENYTKPGDVILDPMAGCGTVLIACTMGRHVITVELEAKFVQMQTDNWEKIQTLGPELGYSMGMATILQGDARAFPDVLADVVISSPPYAESDISQTHMTSNDRGNPANPNYRPSWKRKLDEGYAETKRPYADVIMTSPPYAEAQSGGGIAQKGYQGNKHSPTDLVGKRSYMPNVHGNSSGQIGNLPYGSIDAVITSPPYEEAMGDKHFSPKADSLRAEKSLSGDLYSNERHQEVLNIGNLKGKSYLSAMLEVYQGCCRVLKPQGLMCLVTKNFIRNKQEIRLDLDTIKLCEQAGFELIERHYRKLTSQSFWRTIYQQKFPDAPVLDREDILVFKPGVNHAT